MDGTGKVWDSKSGRLIVDLIGHAGGISSACFSPDGTQVLTASLERSAKVWDAVTGKLLKDFVGHDEGLYVAQYSPDGRTIITCSYIDHNCKLWNVDLAVKRGWLLIQDLIVAIISNLQ